MLPDNSRAHPDCQPAPPDASTIDEQLAGMSNDADYARVVNELHPAEWVNVETRLPKLFADSNECDVRLRDGSILCGAIHQSDGDWWWRERFFDASEITHWRPRSDESLDEPDV